MNPQSPGTQPLRTPSLRRRVIVAAVLVIAAVLALLVVATDLLFAAQTRRDTATMLQERAAVAQRLTAQRVPAREIVDRLEEGGVAARLTTAAGQFGSARLPEGAPTSRLRNGLWRVGTATVLERRLNNGSQLLLVADGDEVTAAQRRLRRLLVIVGLSALAVATVALVLVVRVALAPLDTMTAVARSIARGDRGRRLSPTRADTELGRTARAFDEMVDALEGAERAARHAEAQARASEGRTRQFVADAAHELRTPIAGVQAAAEAVLQTGVDGPSGPSGVDGVGDPSGPDGADRAAAAREERERMHLLLVREARRAGRLVEDPLALARIDAGLDLHPSPVDVATLARAEAERTRLLAPQASVTVFTTEDSKNLPSFNRLNRLGNESELSLRSPQSPVSTTGDSAIAFADPERIAQVLANLLDNARRHTPPSGSITIGVRRAGPAVEVTVADTGPGVPPHARERIFDRLVRLDPARSGHGGAGLGLAIARGIARAHGGDLRCVEPATGVGALFVLTLPAAPPSPDAPTYPMGGS